MLPEWPHSAPTPTQQNPDPVALLLQKSSTPDNPGGPRVLQVAQIVGDAIADVRLFDSNTTVRLAGRVGSVLAEPPGRQPPFGVLAEWLQSDEVDLFRYEGGGWVLRVNRHWGGYVSRGETRTPLADLRSSGTMVREGGDWWTVRLQDGERVVVNIGGVMFVAGEATKARRVPRRSGDGADRGAAFVALAFGLGALLLGVALGTVPPPPVVSMNDQIDHDVRTNLYLLPTTAPTPTVARSSPRAAARAAGAEGKRGGGTPRGEHEVPKGILDMLANNEDLAALRSGSLDGGLVRGIAGLVGSRGASNGPGLGWRGMGPGAGGRVADADGVSFTGDRRGARDLAYGALGSGPTQHALPKAEEAITLGRYDRSLIDEVVKRHLNEIRYCYQREVAHHPEIAGKVTVKFTIANDGTVSSSLTKSSTLHSPGVEACLNTRFMRMRFPAPQYGGIVIVSYPFVFSTAS